MPKYANGKIYTLVNSVNNTIYVGSTAVPLLCTRMGGHRANAKNMEKQSQIYTAMRTLGSDKFSIVLHHLFPCTSKDELVSEEMKVLDLYIAAGTPVYNSIIAGKPDAETRERMAAAHRGEVFTDERKRKISKALQGIGFSFGSLRYQTDKVGRGSWRFQSKGYVKSFSCKKHGYWQARLMAQSERKKMFPLWKSKEEEAIDDIMAIALD